jgi:hypothetical protein
MKMIVVTLLLAAATPVQAQTVHTLENSRTAQDRINARWLETHPHDNMHDNRSMDERFPVAAKSGQKLDCTISHDSNTNINTISNCRMVPR